MFRVLYLAVFCLICASLVRGYLDEADLTDDLKELKASLRKQCLKEIGIDEAIVEATHEGQFPNDSKLKCYMKCILSEGGAMDDKGNLDFTTVEELIPEKLKTVIKNMIDKCTPQATNSDPCEKSFEFYTCCYKEDPKNYFLV